MIYDFLCSLIPSSGTAITFAGLLAYVIAQGIKTIIDIRKKWYFEWNDLFDGWGMPSAHTAVVVAVMCIVGWIDGLNSHLFSFSVVIAAIVIYDAMNIRFHAWEQARILNRITEKLSEHHDDIQPTSFKHPLWHTLPEVIGGLVVWVITSAIAFKLHEWILVMIQGQC